VGFENNRRAAGRPTFLAVTVVIQVNSKCGTETKRNDEHWEDKEEDGDDDLSNTLRMKADVTESCSCAGISESLCCVSLFMA
jgi:hypothetical protein